LPESHFKVREQKISTEMAEPNLVVVIFSILGSHGTLGRSLHIKFVKKGGKITAPYSLYRDNLIFPFAYF